MSSTIPPAPGEQREQLAPLTIGDYGPASTASTAGSGPAASPTAHAAPVALAALIPPSAGASGWRKNTLPSGPVPSCVHRGV